MTNAEAWQNYVSYTKELTEFSRRLAFAAGAVCWFFKTKAFTFPSGIYFALAVLCIYFLLDIGQYFVASVKWRSWLRAAEIERHRAGGSLTGEYWPPGDWDKWPARLWRAKIGVLVLAYLMIVVELARRGLS